MNERGPLQRWGLLGTALALGCVLIGTGLANWQSAQQTAVQAARGQGDVYVAALTHLVRTVRGPPDADDLEELLAEYEPSGLRYVGITRPDGQVVLDVGTPEGSGIPPQGTVQSLGEVVRIGVVAGPPRRPRGPPRSPLFPPPPGSQPGFDGPPPAGRPPPALLVIEYVPTLAVQLRSRATLSLLASGFSAVCLMGLAAFFWRTSLREEAAQRELLEGRRLAALGEMSAVLAHEIRNPLASLKGHAQLLAESLAAEDPKSAKVDRIVGEAERLETLITELLEWARSGRVATNDVLVSALVADAVASVDPSISTVVSGTDRWQLDRDRMHRVLANLLGNAVAVSESPASVSLWAQRRGEQLEIQITDTGPGVSDLDRIFEPFYTTKTRGVGLGLAVSKRIVELHGGTLTATNLPKGGAQFTISLPRGE